MSYNNSLASLSNSNQSFSVFLENIWGHDTVMFNLVALMTCTVNLLLAPVAMAGNAEAEFFPQDTVLSSARWTSLYRFLYWSFHPATIRSEYTSRVKGEQKTFLCREQDSRSTRSVLLYRYYGNNNFHVHREMAAHESVSLITNGRAYKILGVFFILPILYLPFGLF